MDISITLDYKKIFGEPRPDKLDLISEYHSELVLSYLSILNAMLQRSWTQIQIFDFISREWNDKFKSKLYESLIKYFKENNSSFVFIHREIICKWIDYELNNFRYKGILYSEPLDEFQLFKTIILLSDELGQVYQKEFTDASIDEEFVFQSKLWSNLLPQYKYHYRNSSKFDFIKSICLIDEIRKDKKLRKYLDKFSEDKNVNEGFPKK
jgi:hypothetical protein